MSYLRREVQRLRREAEERRQEAAERGMSAPERLKRRAVLMATRKELEDMAWFMDEGGDWWDDPAFMTLWERVLRRAATSLADGVRRRRDLLWRELNERGINRHGARTARMHAVQFYGAEPITDPHQAEAALMLITDPDSTRDDVLMITGRR